MVCPTAVAMGTSGKLNSAWREHVSVIARTSTLRTGPLAEEQAIAPDQVRRIQRLLGGDSESRAGRHACVHAGMQNERGEQMKVALHAPEPTTGSRILHA
ncbi:MAG: hypothetical protein M3P51_14795 [Chloroflexota bacterium]|nr:hypothetical protein [Chloroflexota bacterium]